MRKQTQMRNPNVWKLPCADVSCHHALEPADVGHWFRDLARHLGACRFNDCVHETEPGCAVKAAVESGEIAAWRYESYLRILQGVRDDTPDAY